MTAPVAVGTQIINPSVASACTEQGRFYYADVYSNTYSGGIDGAGATLDAHTTSPYVCDDTQEHSVESTALWLPYANNTDVAEIGEDRGEAGAAHGSCTCPGQYYYFQYVGLPSQNTSYLDVEGYVVGTAHHHSVQEMVRGCPSACQLYAHFVTDATAWSDINLPSGDNPGTYAVVNGEVYSDPRDYMGNGPTQGADWTYPQVHGGGSWYSWGSASNPGANFPYCAYINQPSPVYDLQNLGPVGSYGC